MELFTTTAKSPLVLLWVLVPLIAACGHSPSRGAVSNGELGEPACGPNGSSCLEQAATARARGDKAAQIRMLEIGCTADDASACYHAGRFRANAKQPETARLLIERSCALGSPDGCRAAAEIWFTGFGLSPNKTTAVSYLERACVLRHPRSCFELGAISLSFAGENHHARAREAFERSCELGAAGGCFALGAMLMQGRGGAADPARGRELVVRACTSGETQACSAIALSQCEAGSEEACALTKRLGL